MAKKFNRVTIFISDMRWIIIILFSIIFLYLLGPLLHIVKNTNPSVSMVFVIIFCSPIFVFYFVVLGWNIIDDDGVSFLNIIKAMMLGLTNMAIFAGILLLFAAGFGTSRGNFSSFSLTYYAFSFFLTFVGIFLKIKVFKRDFIDN